MFVVSCLVQFFIFFHPVSSSTQQRPAFCSEWGRDAFLTLHLDLKGLPYSDTRLAQSTYEGSLWNFFPLGIKCDSVFTEFTVFLCIDSSRTLLLNTNLTGLLQQDVIPLAHDVYPFSLPLPDQLRSWTHIPEAGQCRQESGLCVTVHDMLAVHFARLPFQTQAARSKSRKETGKPQCGSFTSPW